MKHFGSIVIVCNSIPASFIRRLELLLVVTVICYSPTIDQAFFEILIVAEMGQEMDLKKMKGKVIQQQCTVTMSHNNNSVNNESNTLSKFLRATQILNSRLNHSSRVKTGVGKTW